jgi:hypothetical protein
MRFELQASVLRLFSKYEGLGWGNLALAPSIQETKGGLLVQPPGEGARINTDN